MADFPNSAMIVCIRVLRYTVPHHKFVHLCIEQEKYYKTFSICSFKNRQIKGWSRTEISQISVIYAKLIFNKGSCIHDEKKTCLE